MSRPASRSPRAAAARAKSEAPGVRALAAQATRNKILKAATRLFARSGYEGTSVESISRAAGSKDRMIYYYFGSKEGLFVEVLEAVYQNMNESEAKFGLDMETPLESMIALIRLRLRHYRDNPGFIRLLNTENLHQGRHLSKSPQSQRISSVALSVVDELLRSGAARGLFRQDISARDVWMLVASLGYFFHSNQYTLSAFLGEDLHQPEAGESWENFVVDAVLRVIRIQPPSE